MGAGAEVLDVFHSNVDSTNADLPTSSELCLTRGDVILPMRYSWEAMTVNVRALLASAYFF